jgi:TetR/AcrR family transcriptional regulator
MNSPAKHVRRRPQQERSVETRERILDEALRQFSQRGFDATSVREISVALGTNHGLVSYYFGSKEQLWHEAVTLLFDRLTQAIAAPESEAPLPTRARFEAFLRRYVAYCASHPEHGRLMMQESMHDNARIAWAARTFIADSHARIGALLGELIAEGALPQTPVIPLIYILSSAAQAPYLLAPEIAHTHGLDVMTPAAIANHAEIILRLFLRGTESIGTP